MFNIIFISFSILYGLIYFVLAAKTKKPFKTILFYAFMGVASLILVNLTSSLSGIYLPINQYTLGSTAALGLPATVTLLILKIIFV